MQRKQVLLALAILVALSPFVGLPYGVLMWVLPILGAVIILAAYLNAGRSARPEPLHDTAREV